MKKWFLLLVLMLLSFAAIALFGNIESENIGSEILPEQVQRIVSMAPNLTEILFALGLDEKIVGVTEYSNHPSAAKTKPRIGTFWQPNIEAIIAANPDLVVTIGFPQQRTIADRLKRIGCNCLTVDIENVPEFFEAVEKIATVTGTESQAKELISGIRSKLEKLAEMTQSEKKVKVLWVVQREPLMVAGRKTFINEMIELAGGENAIGPTLQQYPSIGAEKVITCNADVIIEPLMWQADLQQQQVQAIQYWSKLKNVPAIENGRIYIIDGDAVSRLGPRLYEGTETIAKCLNPELFEK